MAIVLGYFDHWVTQQEVRDWAATRPGPCYIPWYLADQGLLSEIYRFPLDPQARLGIVRSLLAENIPVIVLQPLEIGSHISHYRVAQGYDDSSGELIFDDPLLGPDHHIPYDVFGRLLNRPGALFVPVYREQQEPRALALVRDVYARRWTNSDGRSCSALWTQAHPDR